MENPKRKKEIGHAKNTIISKEQNLSFVQICHHTIRIRRTHHPLRAHQAQIGSLHL